MSRVGRWVNVDDHGQEELIHSWQCNTTDTKVWSKSLSKNWLHPHSVHNERVCPKAELLVSFTNMLHTHTHTIHTSIHLAIVVTHHYYHHHHASYIITGWLWWVIVMMQWSSEHLFIAAATYCWWSPITPIQHYIRAVLQFIDVAILFGSLLLVIILIT